MELFIRENPHINHPKTVILKKVDKNLNLLYIYNE